MGLEELNQIGGLKKWNIFKCRRKERTDDKTVIGWPEDEPTPMKMCHDYGAPGINAITKYKIMGILILLYFIAPLNKSVIPKIPAILETVL